MHSLVSFLRTRAVLWLGLMALGGTQAGCAHTVWAEPSVVVHARVGGPVYGAVYGPAPVVVMPAPVWVPPPRVVVTPPVILPVPSYNQDGWEGRRGYRHGHKHGYGHRHGHGGWR